MASHTHEQMICARDCREATDLLIWVSNSKQWECVENALNVQ